MARYTAVQIYAFARAAGFDPDQAVTMTAVALAESGGRSTAHATRGEDSRGLWQINAAAHPEFAGVDLWDPKANAAAAFQVSHRGADVSPWTTTHGGTRAAYVRYRSDAESAASAYGDVSARGVWSGTSGYGDPLAAGHADGAGDVAVTDVPTQAAGHTEPAGHAEPTGDTAGHNDDSASTVVAGPTGDPLVDALAARVAPAYVAEATAAASTPATAGHGTTRAEVFVAEALAQRGDRYVMGATARTADPNPSAFDCSELVHWASARAGMSVPDGALPQYLALRKEGLAIPVEQAIHTRGALLFTFASPPDAKDMRPAAAHVAISLGDGHTIEARGRAYGVDEFEATTRRFQYAALLPGASDHTTADLAGVADSTSGGADSADAPTGPDGRAVATGGALLDTDGDGLPDRLEQRLGLDPYQADTDHDLVSDTFELLFGHTDPLVAQTATTSWGSAADAYLLAAVTGEAGISGEHAASASDDGAAGSLGTAYAPVTLVADATKGDDAAHSRHGDALADDAGARDDDDGPGLGPVHAAGSLLHGLTSDVVDVVHDVFDDGSDDDLDGDP